MVNGPAVLYGESREFESSLVGIILLLFAYQIPASVDEVVAFTATHAIVLNLQSVSQFLSCHVWHIGWMS
jgi:hypothetical protein